MFRVYLKDKSFYDIKSSKNSDLHSFADCTINHESDFIVLETTCGEVAINKSAIIKIIKL